MASSNLIQTLDTAVADFLGTWNSWTTVLAIISVVILLWPLLTSKEPDLHPFILARQAQAAPVRQEGQSAVYRSYELPFGYPLRRGLGIKDPGTPKWNAGRDGDLRDVWRAAVTGPVDDEGAPSGIRGKIFSIRGKDKPGEHTFDEVTAAINSIGKYLQENGVSTVAVCLPNSVELLASIFASVFYKVDPILVPFGPTQTVLNKILSQTNVGTLIAEAGSMELSAITSAAPSIKHIIWVAKENNKHLDWNEVPAGVGGSIELSTWHEIVEERKTAGSSQVPLLEKESSHGPISSFVSNGKGDYQRVDYSVTNIVAATAALRASIARSSKLTPTDIVLPTTPLTDSYTLCWIMAALISNASVALNSVSGDNVDINVAVPATIKPTCIVTSSQSILKSASQLGKLESGLAGLINTTFNRRSLTSGVFPSSKSPSILKAYPNLTAVRLLFISQSTTASTDSRISSSTLSKLRLALGVRIGYALTTPLVAGAITQSNVLDYRTKANHVNVGVAVTSCEIFLSGDEESVGADRARGKLNVVGPAVVGDKLALSLEAEIDKDHTLNLV